METWPEPARTVPVIGHPDVLVVGAGAAGVAAAVSSARRGADTWLIDAAPSIGGLATLGLIALLLTLDDGAGTQVVGGLCQEVVDRLTSRGAAVHPGPPEWNREDPEAVEPWRRWGLIWGAPESVRYSVAYDPEAFIDVCYDLLREAGVRLRLHTWFSAVDPPAGGAGVGAVLVESKAGRQAILPRVVVDGTGDADVMVAAGAPVESVSIPPYLWFRAAGVVEPAAAGGPLWFRTPDPGRMLVPWGPSSDRVDPCDPDDMTRATLACRQEARRAFEDLKRDVPGFEQAWLDDYARMLGITESRRLVGDYVLSKEDGDTAFADAIARTGHWTRRGVVFDVPFRCLTAPGQPNVVAAGRCISTSRYVHQATKEIPAAMATGEAAGAAAAMAAAAGVDVHGLDVDALRMDLQQGGALVVA